MLEVHYDPSKRVVLSKSAGFQTASEAASYLILFDAAAAESRASCGELKVLIDITESTVQSPEVMAVFADAPPVITGPTDRMALIVSSSLAKIQAARNFRTDQEKAFLSRDAALLWLLASRN